MVQKEVSVRKTNIPGWTASVTLTLPRTEGKKTFNLTFFVISCFFGAKTKPTV